MDIASRTAVLLVAFIITACDVPRHRQVAELPAVDADACRSAVRYQCELQCIETHTPPYRAQCEVACMDKPASAWDGKLRECTARHQ